MAEIYLTQPEADLLISMEKHRLDETTWNYPSMGGKSISIPLVSADRREDFLLDISRGRIDLKKGTYQNRARKVVVLVRLDFAGPPHRNPDDEEIPSPHLHIYMEGFGDKWARDLPQDKFPRITDPAETLDDFMRFCNVTQPPNFQMGLMP